MATILEIAFAVLATLLGTKYIIAYSLRNRILDIPNERSSHSQPTPRGGGMAFVIAIVLGCVYFYLTERMNSAILVPLLIGGGAIACVGWMDDKKGLPARTRFAVHCFAAGIALGSIGIPGQFPFEGESPVWPFLHAAFFFIAILWLTNSYNFMDGIDGLAAGQAISIALPGAFLCQSGSAPFCLLVAATVTGFLYWNWPPAKIFMGDVGSGFLGYVFALAWLWEARCNLDDFYIIPILLATFIADSTLTLFWRMWRGEKWYVAHSLHVYQICAKKIGHGKVTLLYIAVTLFWLTPMAWLTQEFPEYSLFFLLAAYGPLIVFIVNFHKKGAHFPNPNSRERL